MDTSCLDWKSQDELNKQGVSTPVILDLSQLPHSSGVLLPLKVWANRRPQYGDGWKDAKEYKLLAMIMEKASRLERNFESGKKDYESKEDTLIDIINWAQFYLQNLEDGKYK